MKKIIIVLFGMLLLFSSCTKEELKTVGKDEIGIKTNGNVVSLLSSGEIYNSASEDVKIFPKFKTLKYKSSMKKNDTTRVDMSFDIEVDLSKIMDSTYIVENIKNIKVQTYTLSPSINSLLDYK